LPLSVSAQNSISSHEQETELLHENRIAHIHELIGKRAIQSSTYKKTTQLLLDEGHLLPFVVNALPNTHKNLSENITNQIISSSIKHKLDPVFLIAVILTESSFNPSASGSSGEIGLMQLMPATAKWISKKYQIEFNGPNDLANPIKNIEIGSAYLAYLKNKFESRARLYISAYNMGPTNVKRALRKSIVPKDYAKKIMRNYKDLYAHISEIENFQDAYRMPASLR
jgi:soluble lytic murein transglycosylase